MKPLLSIIVPVYNAAPWLCKCLDSLRNQTFTNWEAILIDDGSTDGSGEICREYSARDNRFSFFARAHQGLVSARLSGVKEARGPMVGFVDADDWIEATMYDAMMAASKGVEAVICGYFRHSGDVIELPPIFPGKGIYQALQYESFILDEMLCAKDRSTFDPSPILWNMLLPTQLVRQSLERMDKSMSRGEDALCVYTCLLQIRSLACIDKPLYHYRIHSNSVMARVGFGNYRDTVLFYNQLAGSIKNLRPSLLPQVNSLFLYLISLGTYENPSLLANSKVREILWKEPLLGFSFAWKRRVLLMRIKSLFIGRPKLKEKEEDNI